MTGTGVQYLYVVGGDSISVLDPATGDLVAVFGGIGSGIVNDAVISPDGSRLYVAVAPQPGYPDSGEVLVFGLPSGQPVPPITDVHARAPQVIALSPDGRKACISYAPHADGVGSGIAVLALDPDGSGSVTATVPLPRPIPFGSGAIAVSPDGSVLYAASPSDDANHDLPNLTLINPATSRCARQSYGPWTEPYGMVVSPDGTRAYVGDTDANKVWSLDTQTLSAVQICQDVHPLAVSVSPDGACLYVADYDRNTVLVIDTATSTVTATIPVGSGPDAILVSGTTLYVGNLNDNTLSVIDTTTNTVTSTWSSYSLPKRLVQAPVPVPPAVTAISPAHGSTVGGTVVTVTGTGLAGATAVSFGGTPASGVTVHGDTSLTATAPAHAAGAADVTVATANGTSTATSASQYTYDPPVPVAVRVISPVPITVTGPQSVRLAPTLPEPHGPNPLWQPPPP